MTQKQLTIKDVLAKLRERVAGAKDSRTRAWYAIVISADEWQLLESVLEEVIVSAELSAGEYEEFDTIDEMVESI